MVATTAAAVEEAAAAAAAAAAAEMLVAEMLAAMAMATTTTAATQRATANYSDHRDGHSFLDRCDSRRPLLSRWKITMLSSFVLFASRAEISYRLKAATSAWELETREGETRTDRNYDDR